MSITNKVSNKSVMPGITAVPDVVDAPTIGSATDLSTGGAVSVAYTAAVTGGAATSFTAISTPGSITGSSATSPITVSGLTNNTSYTFKVYGANSSGTWSAVQSSASNSVTPTIVTAFESIATVTVGSGGASYVEFTSIPSTYRHLQIRWIARSNYNSANNIISMFGRFNSDTGANYGRHQIYGDGSTIAAGGSASASSFGVSYVPADGYASGMFGGGVIDILDYANANKYKTLKTLGGCDTNGTGTEKGIITLWSGVWQSTSAITSIRIACASDLSSGLARYSHFALYGIKGV